MPSQLCNMGGLQHDAATSTWQFCTGSTVQTAGLGLVATVGTLVLASKTLSFIRALLSIFVLPGKSVCEIVEDSDHLGSC